MRAAAMMVMGLLGAGGAAAQRQPMLDLGAAPKAPAPGQGAGALALADDLRRQAEVMEHGGGVKERAKGAARRLAARLLADGEGMGQAGSERVVIGRTLARGMEGIDRAIEGAGGAGDTSLSLVTRDLLGAGEALDAAGADPWRVVRDGLAALTGEAGEGGACGWVPVRGLEDGPLAPDIEAWARVPGLTAAGVEAIRAVDALAEEGARWPAFRGSAGRMRAAVRGAMAGVVGAPAWVPEGTRRIMAEQVSAAVVELADASRREVGLAMLERRARLGALAGLVDQVEESPAVRKLQSAVAQELGSTAVVPGGEPRRFASFERVIRLALARRGWPEDKAVTRQARPAWRVLTAAVKAGEAKVAQALVEVLARDDAMTDPGVAAVVAAQRRAVQDAEGLLGLHAWMVGPGAKAADPDVLERWRRVGDRVLKLGQEMGKAEAREAAAGSLREMGEQGAAFMALAGEESLRAAVLASREAAAKGAEAPPKAVWSVLTDGREGALLSEISDRRGTWMDGWDKAGFAASAGEVARLAALRGLMEVMWDAAGVVPPPPPGEERTAGYAGLCAWPGWELSGDGFAAITGGLVEQLTEATRAITGGGGDAGKCNEIVAVVRRDFAAALLAGRLAREAERWGAAAAPRSVMLEVGGGGPVEGVSWMGEWAGELADVCRYAEEVAAARKLGAKDRAAGILTYVNSRATEVTP